LTSFITMSRLVLWPTQPPIQWVQGTLSPGYCSWSVKAAHLPQFSAEVLKFLYDMVFNMFTTSLSVGNLNALVLLMHLLTSKIQKYAACKLWQTGICLHVLLSDLSWIWYSASGNTVKCASKCVHKQRDKFIFISAYPVGSGFDECRCRMKHPL
jgi:hypothetical protein